MRPCLLVLSLLLAAPARAAAPGGLAVTAALGGGAEVGRSSSTGVGELELGAGWEMGDVRPELAVVVGLAPGSYAGVRPGLHAAMPATPVYARAALDLSHAGGEWRLRWLLLGAGLELRVTSVLGAFVEADLGLPPGGDAGVGALARAGFAFRL